MAITLTELQQMRDDLQRGYYSGVAEIQFSDGRRIKRPSADDFRKMITDLEDAIKQASGQTQGNTAVAQHRRGDGPSGPPRWYW